MASRSRTSSCASSLGRAVLAVAALLGLVAAGAACSKKRAPIAELASAAGPVEHQEGAAAWQPAPIGTRFFLGDAAKTGPGSAELAITGGAKIAMQPQTILRFGGAAGAAGAAGERRLVVETGAVELTGTGSYGLDVGDVTLSRNGTLRISARDGKQAVELRVGEAQISSAGRTIELQVGRVVELGIGDITVTSNVDAGVPAPPPPEVAPDAAIDPTPAAAGVEIQLKGRVESQAPGEPAWKVLPPETTQLEQGTRLRLAAGASAKLTALGVTLELGGGSRAAIEDELVLSLELGPGRASATTDGRVKLPGGAITLQGTAADGPSEARLDAGTRDTRVAVQRGAGRLSGAPGTELAMSRGESATLTRGGAIRVLEAIPKTFDFRVTAGESLTVHDPRGAPAVQFVFGERCPDGGIVELDRDGRFRTPRVSGGKAAANLRVEVGAWSYRLRCTAGRGEGGAVASGRIAVIKDGGTRALPKLRPPNDIDADGRTWRVSYQSVIPDLRVKAKGSGASYKLHVAQGGRADQFTASGPTITIPGAKLKEGTYTYWVDIDGVKQDKVSTLIINFDQTAAQVYIESPQNNAAWAGDLEVRGAVLPGWSAAVEGVEIPIDKQRRFAARVGTPPGTALAIRLSHPQRGIHYYLRRGK